jgi:uncharacterized membrane protein YjjP (DUF1212 family)
MSDSNDESRALQAFLVRLGAAMNASGQPVDAIQDRLVEIATVCGVSDARVNAYPTSLMLTLGLGEPATLENTTAFMGSPRLDQISGIDRLGREASRGEVAPEEGLRRLEVISGMPRRTSPLVEALGYAVLSVGVCLVLRPSMTDVVAAAIFGLLVGVLQLVGPQDSPVRVLMPVISAFAVASLSALAVKWNIAEPGVRAIVAPLVVFLPGAALCTSVVELGSGQVVAGASRLVSGAVQLALLAFGVLAAVQAVGVPASVALGDPLQPLGAWTPWLGVLLFAIGVTFANSAPSGAFPGLLAVLGLAWCGQVVGNALLGGYGSAVVGASVMTVAAFAISRLPSAMPPHASFLPGFWLLVPGALGLIGLTRAAGGAALRSGDLIATIGSIVGVAIGVLCGTQLWRWAVATGRVLNEVSGSVAQQRPWRRNHR